MKLFVEKRELSINDLINRLPPMDRKCKSCGGNGVGLNGTCEKCVKGKSKVDISIKIENSSSKSVLLSLLIKYKISTWNIGRINPLQKIDFKPI